MIPKYIQAIITMLDTFGLTILFCMLISEDEHIRWRGYQNPKALSSKIGFQEVIVKEMKLGIDWWNDDTRINK